MTVRTILVVDDNRANLKLCRVLLQSEGYAVLVASNATEALALVDEGLPDLILMDLQMPGMDGFALTRRLKGDPRTRAIPVIAFTSYAMKGDAEKARAAGCDDYATKPIDTRTFPALLARHLP